MKKSTKTGRPSDRQTQNGSAEGARKKKKSNKLSTAILLIAFSIGLVLCLYPTVSDRWNAIHQSKAIAAYTEFVADMDEDEYGHILERAHAYNEKMKSRLSEFFPTDEEMEEYYSCLDVTGTGIMGYVQIDKINVKLPIYHGTEDTVLQVATGHLDWTSLPVGGEGTHCVISGHRGLPSAKLFTDLDKLEPGGETDAAAVLHEAAERIPRRSVVFVIGDLFGDPDAIVNALHHFRFRFDEVVVLQVMADEELEFPFSEMLRFEDAESDDVMNVDAQALRNEYLDRVNDFRAKLKKGAGEMRITLELVNTRVPYDEALSDILVRYCEPGGAR